MERTVLENVICTTMVHKFISLLYIETILLAAHLDLGLLFLRVAYQIIRVHWLAEHVSISFIIIAYVARFPLEPPKSDHSHSTGFS